MRGFIAYTPKEAERNRAFIEELLYEAEKVGICLKMWTSEELSDGQIDFILSRRRNADWSAQWESKGIRVLNRAAVNRIANDKWSTFELAVLLGIPTVQTKKALSVKDIQSYPCVLKTIDGHGGSEVSLCHSPDEGNAFFSKFEGRSIIVQPYVESHSRDVRVFMLGNEVLGAVLRTGQDSFKSNFTLGGTVEKYELSTSQVEEVQKITNAIKSDYIGIDFLLLPDGRWLLNEIEDPVGARSLYQTHDFSVAERLIQYIKQELTK